MCNIDRGSEAFINNIIAAMCMGEEAGEINSVQTGQEEGSKPQSLRKKNPNKVLASISNSRMKTNS